MSIDLATRQMLILSAEALIDKLKANTPRCRSCEFYFSDICNKHNEKPPAHILSSGCEDWRYDTLGLFQ